jgi:hypothetical protein
MTGDESTVRMGKLLNRLEKQTSSISHGNDARLANDDSATRVE